MAIDTQYCLRLSGSCAAIISILLTLTVISSALAADLPDVVGSAASSGQQPGTDSDSIEICHWIDTLDEVGSTLAVYYFNRQSDFKAFGDCRSIPFMFPTRPTISVRVGETDYQLLFDTGTYTCILRLPAGADLPIGMQLTDAVTQIAHLEAKNPTAGSVKLDYGIARYMKLGDIRVRDTAFRVYTYPELASVEITPPEHGIDFQGAIAPVIFRDAVLEVDNDAQLITLHDQLAFVPPAGSLVLPLLTLPRGLFIPLAVDRQVYWFHLDTGFSGNLGLLQATADRHGINFDAQPAQVYQGWRGSNAYQTAVVTGLSVKPYGSLTWADDGPHYFDEMETVLYPDVYGELSDYDIGGIVGSGLLSRFNYFLDMRLSRLYLLPRE